MQHFPLILSKTLIAKAYAFTFLRARCKKYLADKKMEYDKFSSVLHDSFTGYISEFYVKKILGELFKNSNIKIQTWDEQYDLKKINSILSKNSAEAKDIRYIKNYFYDSYDLALIKDEKQIYIDVKTAFTSLQPKSKWNFLYPVVQAHKKGKDIMILVYYVVEDLTSPESLKELVLAGFITENTIKNCYIIKKGQKTKFGTLSHIDNYVTELSKDYSSDMHQILKFF